MCKLVASSGEVALSEDGVALLLCPWEAMAHGVCSVSCVWVRGDSSSLCGAPFGGTSWVTVNGMHAVRKVKEARWLRRDLGDRGAKVAPS